MNKKLLRIVEETVTVHGMLKEKDSVVIGVSGGPDSVALLHVLRALTERFSLKLGIAHLNHCLRQNDSDKEAAFVETLSDRLGLPFHIDKEDVHEYKIKNRLSLEEAARRVRYTFLNRVAETNRYNKIALGHHSDDNAELVLMNLFRGSGPLGLSGIFLNQNRLEYVSDASNRDTRYLRNRVRHKLIPLLKTAYNPKISETLNQLASIMLSEEEWIEDVIHPLFEKSVLNVQDDRITFSVSMLDRLHSAAQRRILRKAISIIKGDLRRISFVNIDVVQRLLEKGPTYGRLDLPDRIRIRRSGDVLLISREKSALRNLDVKSGYSKPFVFEYKIAKPESIFIKEIGAHLEFTEMSTETMPDYCCFGQYTGFFDKDTLSFPMVVRNYRPGDVFRPMGMDGTQKLKKFFIDKKVPRNERIKCPILLSREKIIWVVGHRADESVKMTPSTRNVLKVELFLA
ncbi:MAG: tRNA lysidine(34) synthetase TilS [Deltaproteobacteria bacterium]|nr:tRNA lysidine(34) synthetase TilS [Deltaproteobacteria bacterium]